MDHETKIKNENLEKAIKAELEAKQAFKGDFLMQLLNKFRLWAIPKEESYQKEKHEIYLEPWEKEIRTHFDKLRNDHRKLSYHYSDQYKGSYYLNYKLAVMAVIFAVVSLGLLYFDATYGEDLTECLNLDIESIVIILGFLKLGVLLTIYVNSKQAKNTDFNERAITYRLLMEQFRYMLYLPLLGIHKLPSPVTDRYISAKWQKSFVQQYFREQVGEVLSKLASKTSGQQLIDFNTRLIPILQYIKTDWINEQERYHKWKAEIESRKDEIYETRVKFLNIFVIIIVIIDLLVGMGIFVCLPEECQLFLHQSGTPFILILATIIPALVASYNARRFQTEAKKISDRSFFMHELLIKYDHDFNKLITTIQQQRSEPGNPGSFTSEAMNLVNETTRVMLDEVTEWTYIYTKSTMEP